MRTFRRSTLTEVQEFHQQSSLPLELSSIFLGFEVLGLEAFLENMAAHSMDDIHYDH